MNWTAVGAIITAIFDDVWLITLLGVLILLLRSSEKRRKLDSTLIDVIKQDAETARQAVEVVRMLAAVLQNEQSRK